ALGGRRVAVKVSFRGGNEARTLGRLEHANVVPVYSVCEDEKTGLTAVVMPYLGCATLHDVLNRVQALGGPPVQAREILEGVWAKSQEELPTVGADSVDPVLWNRSYVEGVVHLGGQLADALAYVHGQGICHLDLKPSNVLL